MEEMTEKACPICDRENPPMGVLGNLIWYRCQDCGAEYHKSKIVPCGYETAPGMCSKPNEEGHQSTDCANCELGTQQALRAKKRISNGIPLDSTHLQKLSYT